MTMRRFFFKYFKEKETPLSILCIYVNIRFVFTIDLILFTLFFTLLILWLFLSEYERHTRQDGSMIPRYFVTYIGNTIGLGSLMLAAVPYIHQITLYKLIFCIMSGLVLCFLVHQYWITQSKQRTIGMYRNGNTPPAGWLHLLFMSMVGSCLFSIIFTYTAFTTESVLWFGLATIVYWTSYSIDHFYRKVL